MSLHRSECYCSAEECPYADRGDFVVYRDEWERVHRELRAARAELTGRLAELEKLYGVLNSTRYARDAFAKWIEGQGAAADRSSGMVLDG